MKLEDHIRALIAQYQHLQQRHKLHAENAYYKFQADMWQAMADDFGIIVEDLQQALCNADDVKHTEQPERLEHIQLKRQLRAKEADKDDKTEHGNCGVLPDHEG